MRLRFLQFITVILLVCAVAFLSTRKSTATGNNATTPMGKPEASVDLATAEGVTNLKGQWRYSDTQIIQVDFKAPGNDNQPSGRPVKTYDYTPHAGGVDFDDSK